MRAKDLEGALELIAADAVYFWSNGALALVLAVLCIAVAHPALTRRRLAPL